MIAEKITLYNPDKELVKWCNKNLWLDNPEYIKKKRMGLFIGKTPKRLCLYETNGNNLIIPFGCLKYISKYIKSGDYATDFCEKRVDFNAEIPLYDYQQKAVEKMLKAKNGILKSAAGSGKTQMGLALAVKLGYKTLWLTHTLDLLEQSYKRACQYIDKKYLGKIAGGRVDIGEGITFATVQSLCRRDLTGLRKEFNTVIVDECHRAAASPLKATQFSKVLSELSARHKIGLSATLHRSDGMIKSCFAMIGDVVCEISDSEISDKIIKPSVLKIQTDLEESESYLDFDGTMIYSRLIDYICSDNNRNALIIKDLKKCENNYCLILSDRIKHLEYLREFIEENKSALITGKTDKKEREKAIEEIRSGRKNYLFATYSLAKEGLDIPRLDRLFLTTPQSDYAVIVQSVGRISRAFEGKKQPIVYDYVDGKINYLKNRFKKRLTHYRKINCVLLK